jgi:ribulose-bisphosphate carboxylase large chain
MLWKVSTKRLQTGAVKGSYLNVTAATMEEMYERAEFANLISSCYDRFSYRLYSNPINLLLGRKNDMIVHLHRAGHSTYTRQKNTWYQLPCNL